MSDSRGNYFDHRHIAEHPKAAHPLCKPWAANAAPLCSGKMWQLRDVSPRSVPRYSLPGKFSMESGFETEDPEALETRCLWGPVASLALRTLRAGAAAGVGSVAGEAGAGPAG